MATTSAPAAPPVARDGPIVIDPDRHRRRGAGHDACARRPRDDHHHRAPTTAPPTTAAPRWPSTTSHGAAHDVGTAKPQTGTATWYEGGTASGCAHLTLPKGTVVTVTAISSGRQVTCTVDDRGPFGSHIIDLSPSGFQALAPLSTGVVSVRITW